MNDIGQAIAGNPQEQKTNVVKDFLTKPENLATALVLAAGLTARRGPGQSKVNQLFTSGVGALGFRGGLEKGVNRSRAATRQEEQTAAAQAADIAQGNRSNEIAADRNDIQRTAITTPAPQSQGQKDLLAAETALANARAGNVGKLPAKPPPDTSFASLLSKNVELARSTSLDGTFDMNQVTQQTLQEQERLRLGELGALVVQDGRLGVDDALVPLEQRANFPSFFDAAGNPRNAPVVPTDTTKKPTDATATPASTESELLKVSGGFGNRSTSSSNLVTKLRKARPEFATQDDQALATTLAEVVDQVRAGSFDTASAEDVQAILDSYGPGLPAKDLRVLRGLIRNKTLRSKFEKINIRTFGET